MEIRDQECTAFSSMLHHHAHGIRHCPGLRDPQVAWHLQDKRKRVKKGTAIGARTGDRSIRASIHNNNHGHTEACSE